MAFSFGGGTQNGFGTSEATPSANALVRTGPDLEEIQTEGLGFLALGGGQAKVQLLPIPWPVDNLPTPTASLMSVASQRGLLAAAGPDAVIIATTELVRKAFEAAKVGESEIRPFQPQLTLPMPMRVSQVIFTADENFLVLSAEIGGGLAVYEVQSLLNGSMQSAFEMSTNSLALRALVPNPMPETGELVAVVTTDGKLMIANLKQRTFVSGANGQVMKDGVSCVAWSNKGKQLVAGLGDGSAYQMTPKGEGKGEIPRPPEVDPNLYVSSITWLENNVFLVISTPSDFSVDAGSTSVFHLVTREPPSGFLYQKITDPAPPFGLARTPPHQFVLRLKDFPPSLNDLLIVASSASTDVGLFARSEKPLAADRPTDNIVGTFARTEVDDSRRAQLAMTNDYRDTSPIGVVLDLSSKDKVLKPIPMDEMDESPTPVPALMVLNNEGVLASWWIIYSESIKQGSMYPGLVVARGSSQPMQPKSTQQNPAFGGAARSASFGEPTFGQSANPVSVLSAFRPSGPTFGNPTAPSAALLGNRTSPWSTMTTTTPGATFGKPASLGAAAKPVFGGALGGSGGVFGGGSTTVPSSGGFALFANNGGFAAAAPQNTSGDIFASKSATSGFPAPVVSSNVDSDTSFRSTFQGSGKSSGLLGGSSFTLGSTFRSDGSAKDDAPKPSNSTGTSFFGNGFGAALGEAQKVSLISTLVDNEADMDADEPGQARQLEAKVSAGTKPPFTASSRAAPSTTPISTPAPNFQFPTNTTTRGSGLFGMSLSSSSNNSAIPKDAAKSTNFSFGTPSAPAKHIDTSPTPVTPLPTPSVATPKSPKIKHEQSSHDDTSKTLQTIPAAPLPPDTTSKSSYAHGDSSVSSIEPDAPLPPDFIPAAQIKKPEESKMSIPNDKKAESTRSSEATDGPAEEEDSDFGTEDDGDISEAGSEEGSGEDLAQDLSPTSELHQTPGFTPQSSFGGAINKPATDSFFKVPPQSKVVGSRSLFGEIDGRTAPVIPPPKSFPSPRSPSPIRGPVSGRLFRPDASRSVSAPGVASQILGSQKPSNELLVRTANGAFASPLEQRVAETRQQNEMKARKEAEESQALIDEEDDLIQKFLHQEIVGTKILDDFIAHQDYVGNADKDSIPAQVEAVYRDINSMIDTLGLNSCSLKSFIKGHEELCERQSRTKRDLEDEEWCLGEMNSLSAIIEKDLIRKLGQGRVQSIAFKLGTCVDLERDLAKLRTKYEDIKALLASYIDPHHAARAWSEPLKVEQASQQHDLRRDFMKFQKLLTEAEESITLFRAKLTSQGIVNGKKLAGPTVEAVMRTITKMTSMAEKRSGDIDVLENNMRKLRVGSIANNGSREASPFATPAGKASIRTQALSSTLSSTYGLFHTPDSVSRESHEFKVSSASSTHSYGQSSSRRKMNSFTEEDRQQFRTNTVRRRDVTIKLRSALQKSSVRVRPMERG